MKYIIAVDYPCGSFTLRQDVLTELFELDREFFFDSVSIERDDDHRFWTEFASNGKAVVRENVCYPLRTHEIEIRSDERLLAIAAREGIEKIGVGRTRLNIVDVPDGVSVHLCQPDVGGESIRENYREWE